MVTFILVYTMVLGALGVFTIWKTPRNHIVRMAMIVLYLPAIYIAAQLTFNVSTLDWSPRVWRRCCCLCWRNHCTDEKTNQLISAGPASRVNPQVAAVTRWKRCAQFVICRSSLFARLGRQQTALIALIIACVFAAMISSLFPDRSSSTGAPTVMLTSGGFDRFNMSGKFCIAWPHLFCAP